MRPGKDRQAQVDGGSINGINHLVEIESVGVTGIQPSRLADKNLSECFVNTPIPMLVRVSEVCSSYVATNAHCVAVGATPQAGFDVPQTLPKGDLRKGHCQKLITGGHSFARSRHRLQRHAAIELLSVDQIGNLCEDEASGVHPSLRMNLRPDDQPVQMRHTRFSSLASRNEQPTKLK